MVVARDAQAAGSITRRGFGSVDGVAVDAITLDNGRIAATILSYGGIVQSMMVPDRDGIRADVAPGFATIDDYVARSPYFGATVGRVANRIAHGRFTLDGTGYRIAPNNGANALHGGAVGFDKAVWTVDAINAGDAGDAGEGTVAPTVVLGLVSPHGDQGFPGTLTVTATYRLVADALCIDYQATTDAPTVVNLSNHAYWTLGGEGSPAGAMAHQLTLPAAQYLPVDAAQIPTGEFREVAGTAFDFRQPRSIGDDLDSGDPQLRPGRGYDHNWVIARAPVDTPRIVAVLDDAASGRTLEVWSDQPGVQFYSGNFLDGSLIGKSGRAYARGAAVAIEPQRFPDTVNHPAFGSARLGPGEVYRAHIAYRFPEPRGRALTPTA